MTTSCEPVPRMPSAFQVSTTRTSGAFIGTAKWITDFGMALALRGAEQRHGWGELVREQHVEPVRGDRFTGGSGRERAGDVDRDRLCEHHEDHRLGEVDQPGTQVECA